MPSQYNEMTGNFEPYYSELELLARDLVKVTNQVRNLDRATRFFDLELTNDQVDKVRRQVGEVIR